MRLPFKSPVSRHFNSTLPMREFASLVESKLESWVQKIIIPHKRTEDSFSPNSFQPEQATNRKVHLWEPSGSNSHSLGSQIAAHGCLPESITQVCQPSGIQLVHFQDSTGRSSLELMLQRNENFLLATEIVLGIPKSLRGPGTHQLSYAIVRGRPSRRRTLGIPGQCFLGRLQAFS